MRGMEQAIKATRDLRLSIDDAYRDLRLSCLAVH
jgi:hypothetical protein